MNLNIFKSYDENGEEIRCIKFGNYPQTKVSDKTLILKLNEINCEQKEGYIEYLGKQYYYYKADYPSVYNVGKGCVPIFSDGLVINESEGYYFNVEPIIWKIVKEENHIMLLESQMILSNIITEERYLKKIANLKDDISKYRSFNNYSMVNTLEAGLSKMREIQLYEYTKIINSDFFANAFNEEERFLIKVSKDEVNVIKTHSKELKKLIKTNKKLKVTDFAKARGCMFSVKEKDRDRGLYWICDYDSKKKAPEFNYSLPLIGVPAWLDQQIGIRPIIEIYTSEKETINEQLIREEIEQEEMIEDMVEEIVDEVLNEKVTSISFSQVKPEASPIFSGFLQSCLVFSIVGIPIAIIYGIIRGIIEENNNSKFIPNKNALVIDNPEYFTIHVDNAVKKIPFRDIDKTWYRQIEKSTVSLIPARMEIKTYNYGVLTIQTKNKEKYVIENIQHPRGLHFFIKYLLENNKIEKLFNLINADILNIQRIIQMIDSNVIKDISIERNFNDIFEKY